MNYKWDLSTLYTSEEDYQKDLKHFKDIIAVIGSFKGKLNEDSSLHSYFSYQLELEELVNRLYFYAASLADLDRRDVNAVSKESELEALLRQLNSEASYFEPEILSLGEERMKDYFSKYPEHQQFDFSIEKLFSSQSHVLTSDKEKIIADYGAFSSVGGNLYSTLSVGDYMPKECELEDGEKVVVTTSNWTKLITDEKSAENRKRIFDSLYSYFDKHKNTYAEIYNLSLQEQLGTMKARNYSSILDVHLEKNKIPTSVFLNLIDVAHNNSEPLKKYYEIRRKYLGLEKHRSYDRFIPLARSETKVTYDQAREMFFDSIKDFPDDFQNKAHQVSAPGMVDVYPKDGKITGAYSRGGGNLPPMILLNFQDTLEDVFTLAHESGHSIHTLYSEESQPLMKQDYTIFVAEIASTFNEHNLLDYLLNRGTLTKEDKISLLQKAIDEICGTFYRQTLFAEYEYEASKIAEKGGNINYQVLSDIMANLYQDYYGIDIREEVYKPLVWCYIPHLFYTPFYVYQYATSFSASLELYRRVKEKEEGAFEHYVSLLRMGGSDYPIAEVKRAGVDLTTKEPFLAVVKRMETLVDELEKLLNE